MGVEKILTAANNGEVENMVKYARLCFSGLGVEKNVDLAIQWFNKAAESGNAESKSFLAYIYLKGISVERDIDRAIELYKQAAEQEDDVACYSLGLIYKKGLYDKKVNIDKAKALFEKAALKGNFAAKYEVGLLQEREANKLLENPDSINQTKATVLRNKAELAFKEASEKGHIPAKYALGVRYLKSTEKIKQAQALQLFKDCAEKDIAAAYYAIAYIYDLGIGVQRDYWQSYDYYKKAYDSGYNKAILNVIYALMTGLGCKKNYKKAIDLCRDAVNQGLKEANYYAGLCFKYGFEVNKNIDKAAELFGYAAETDFAPAIYQLGQLSDEYYGIGSDNKQAEEYYQLAYDLGLKNAGADLARMKFDTDKKQAFEMMKKVADEGSYVACEMLARLYGAGEQIKQDLVKAVDYYKLAADLGSVSAAEYLVENAKKRNDKAMLLKYQDKIIIKKEPEDYLEAARDCKESKDYERTAFWYAMTAEYSTDSEIKERAQNSIEKFEKGANGLWTLKKETK